MCYNTVGIRQRKLLTKNYGENWPGASAGPNTKKEMAWSLGHMLRRNDDSITK